MKQSGSQTQTTKRTRFLAEGFGLKSILRQPKKALLFLVLLATVVTLLTLVMCVYHAVSGYLDECNEYYHTIAELEYFGSEYPDSHAADPAMAASISGNADTLEALLALPGVLQFDAEDALLGVIPDLRRKDWQVYDKDAAVIVVTISQWERSTASYSAIITEAPFAWGDVFDKITYISLEEGSLQLGDSYVLSGHFINSANNFLLFQPEDAWAGTGDSAQLLPGYMPLNGSVLPEDSPYRALARVLKHRNNGYRISPVTDITTLRPWQQGELKLLDGGRLFTPEEYASDAKVCIISNLLSTVLDLSVGDTVPISLNDCDNLIYDAWTEVLAPVEPYTITGIYYRTSEHPDTLYIPRSAPNQQIVMTTGYTLGQFRLDNDLAADFHKQAQALLPAGYRLTVYDEGYATVSGPYKELQNLSLLFLLICLLVVPGVLALFSYLFISRRRDDALLQRALGVGSAHALRGFLAASLAITLPAAAIGLLAGRLLEGQVLDYIRVLAETLGATDTRFSSANLFTVRHLMFAPVSAASVYVLAGGLFLLFVLVFAAAFSLDAVHERKPRKKKKPRVVHGRTSRLSGRLKYALLSMRRGGMRTLAVLVLCAVIAVFLGVLTSASDQYAAQLQEIRQNTIIRGYATDFFGRYMNGMVIPGFKVEALLQAELADRVNLTWTVSNLRFAGITRTADGVDTGLEDPVIPTSGFSIETLLYKMSKEPKWVATNSISGSPAFYYETDPTLQWLDGYDERCLTGTDAALCVLPVAMMERQGIHLGDTVRYLAWFDDDEEPFLLFDFLVVGSYVLPYGEEVIYTPFGLNFPGAPPASASPEREIETTRAWPGYFDMPWTRMQLSRFSFRSMIFTLRSASGLDALRDALEAIPYEETGVRSLVRDYAVIDDADYISTVQGMERQMRYMNALFICLYAAVMLIGAVGAYLLQNSRKPEIALMRALGVGTPRILLTFLFEQLLLSGIGVLLGMLCFILPGGSINTLFIWLLAAYELCWLSGSTIRMMRALRQKTQELLSEPE